MSPSSSSSGSKPLVLVSPAKSMDTDRGRGLGRQLPRYLKQAGELAVIAGALGVEGLQDLMKISRPLAELNAERLNKFDPSADPALCHAAALSFDGDVYRSLDFASLSRNAQENGERHLRILSGIYGLLRPFDAIQPYRLEMGRPLVTPRGRGLYRFWGDLITRAVVRDMTQTSSKVLLNLASNEYAKSLDLSCFGDAAITPRFLEMRNGKAKVISFSAKRVRGAMARWCLENPVSIPEDIRSFSWNGYVFDPENSTRQAPVFLRP